MVIPKTRKKFEFSNQLLLKSFSDVMDYIKIFNTHRIDDMTKDRIETLLFDEDSVREAVIDAFVHNDWKNEIPPTIFMFDDRFEIFSYGELPYGITQDMIFNGYSRPINSGHNADDQFPNVRKLIEHGKGGKREIVDYKLTRYVCYLIVQMK